MAQKKCVSHVTVVEEVAICISWKPVTPCFKYVLFFVVVAMIYRYDLMASSMSQNKSFFCIVPYV